MGFPFPWDFPLPCTVPWQVMDTETTQRVPVPITSNVSTLACLEHEPLSVVADVVERSAPERIHLVRPYDVIDLHAYQTRHPPASLWRRPPLTLLRRRRRQLPDVDAESGGNDVIGRNAGSVEFELDDVRETGSFFGRNCKRDK